MTPTISQEDREAAAEVAKLLTGAAVEHILEGFEDDTGTVQAFALHRQQARLAALEEGWKAGFDAARQCVSEDEAFCLTEDVEHDAWLESPIRSLAKEGE